MLFPAYLAFVLMALVCVSVRSVSPSLVFPLQFSATVTITSHLIDESSEYPPKRRQMMIYYDYINKKARADIEAGYEAAKIYIRRYDEKKEYMVRLPPISDCKRSYLGEVMPFPDIEDAVYVGIDVIDGVECHHFAHDDHDTKVHMYMAVGDGSPVRLVQESATSEVEQSSDGDADIVYTPMLTYDYSEVMLEAPEDSLFDLPEPHQHSTCVRHVGGFPYLHIFHYFVRF